MYAYCCGRYEQVLEELLLSDSAPGTTGAAALGTLLSKSSRLTVLDLSASVGSAPMDTKRLERDAAIQRLRLAGTSVLTGRQQSYHH